MIRTSVSLSVGLGVVVKYNDVYASIRCERSTLEINVVMRVMQLIATPTGESCAPSAGGWLAGSPKRQAGEVRYLANYELRWCGPYQSRVNSGSPPTSTVKSTTTAQRNGQVDRSIEKQLRGKQPWAFSLLTPRQDCSWAAEWFTKEGFPSVPQSS